MSKGRRKSRRSRRQKRQARQVESAQATVDVEEDLDSARSVPARNRLEPYLAESSSRLGIRDRDVADDPPAKPRDLMAREFFVSRLNHLSRRLEEIHQAEVNRYSEERRETWILVFALAVVLIFCFAAFFMNQMEVRDLRAGLEDELERRSSQTINSIEESLDGFHLDRVPKMQSSIEDILRSKEERDREELAGLRNAMELDRRRSEERYEARLKSLEESILKLTEELSNERQQEPEEDAIGAPEVPDAFSVQDGPPDAGPELLPPLPLDDGDS